MAVPPTAKTATAAIAMMMPFSLSFMIYASYGSFACPRAS
jgi:hypothetical protein